IILTIAMVFTAEFINTAIEAVVDLASPVHHPLAKVGKDVGAGAVLVAALAGVVVGLLILGPPLWAKLVLLFSKSLSLFTSQTLEVLCRYLFSSVPSVLPRGLPRSRVVRSARLNSAN